MIAPRKPPPPPTLVRASVTFHTNDEDKDADTRVDLYVHLQDKRTIVARLVDCLGHFDDNSDSGPYNLVLLKSVTRDQVRTGFVDLQTVPNGEDTWRFNFLLDLYFSDGSHQLAKANGAELSLSNSQLYVGIE